MVSLERRKSCQRRDQGKRITKPYSQPVHNRSKQRQTTAAFFSGLTTPAGRSSVSKRPAAPYNAGPSSGGNRSRVESGIRKRMSSSARLDPDQSPCTKSTRSSWTSSQPVLIYNNQKRCHSLSADIIVPQRTKPTGKPEKPLPELPQPESSTTPIEEECRLSAEDDALSSTPKEVPHDKGKEKALQEKEEKYQSSSISPNHISVCSRGFSGQKIGRPNVPKRTSSARNLRTKAREPDEVEILDRDVLRGLHIAASAACNEQIDAFIREKTGLHIRRFLSDLMPLEILGNNPAQDAKERRAQRRRAEIREVKRRVRRSWQTRERAVL